VNLKALGVFVRFSRPPPISSALKNYNFWIKVAVSLLKPPHGGFSRGRFEGNKILGFGGPGLKIHVLKEPALEGEGRVYGWVGPI
jgi:hypothetical protein